MQTESHLFQPEEIMAYLDGELPVPKAQAAAQHIEECPECRQLATEFRSLTAGLGEWLVRPVSYDAPALELVETPIKPDAPFWRKPWFMIAAAVVVLAGAGFLFRPKAKESVLTTGRGQPLRALKDAPVFGMAQDSVEFQTMRYPAAVRQAQPAVASSGPLIVRSAQLSMTTASFESCRTEVERITGQSQGYISQMEIASPGNAGRSLTAALKIPAAKLDSTIRALRRLGDVIAEGQGANDVTRTYVDSNARLENLQASEARLQEILRNRTGKLSDVLEVEQALDRNRGEINVIEAEQRALSIQIEYAEVQLTVSEDYKAPASGPPAEQSKLTELRNAAIAGYRSAINGSVSVLAFLLSVVPGSLLIAAVAFWPLRSWWRGRYSA